MDELELEQMFALFPRAVVKAAEANCPCLKLPMADPLGLQSPQFGQEGNQSDVIAMEGSVTVKPEVELW